MSTKETQADFGLGDPIETSENEARPLYLPLRDAAKLPGRYLFSPKTGRVAGLPTDALSRKRLPLYSGLVKYFPRALVAVAQCSFASNEQHNPGQPLHWSKDKSTDHEDCMLRHTIDDVLGVKFDEAKMPDGTTVPIRHKTKVAWRALAALEIELEGAVEANNNNNNTCEVCHRVLEAPCAVNNPNCPARGAL